MEHTITPTVEQFRARITALETALVIANVHLRHRESTTRLGKCMVECPKCRAEAVLAVPGGPG